MVASQTLPDEFSAARETFRPLFAFSTPPHLAPEANQSG
jgi:hypothetical protein